MKDNHICCVICSTLAIMAGFSEEFGAVFILLGLGAVCLSIPRNFQITKVDNETNKKH